MVSAIFTGVSVPVIFQAVNIHGRLSDFGETLRWLSSDSCCLCNSISGCTTNILSNKWGALISFWDYEL